MPEPITTVGLGAIAAYLGKDGLEKLLGPTAEYLGAGLRDLTQRRIENIGRIFRNAQEKLGSKADKPGEVPPRVLKAVLDEGSFCNDELAAEYLGGVLASSRTEKGRDDRGAHIAKILSGLSTYQIRSHYLIYSTIKTLFAKSGYMMNMNDRAKMQIYMPLGAYADAMDLSEEEGRQFEPILSHTFFGLHAEDLIEGHWQYGSKEHLVKMYAKAEDGGIVCQPSAMGGELFLWAFGHADKPLSYIFDSSFFPVFKGAPMGVPRAAATKGATAT